MYVPLCARTVSVSTVDGELLKESYSRKLHAKVFPSFRCAVKKNSLVFLRDVGY